METKSNFYVYVLIDPKQPEHHYQMSGNLISVTTLDLNCDFTQIKAQLDKITDQYFI